MILYKGPLVTSYAGRFYAGYLTLSLINHLMGVSLVWKAAATDIRPCCWVALQVRLFNLIELLGHLVKVWRHFREQTTVTGPQGPLLYVEELETFFYSWVFSWKWVSITLTFTVELGFNPLLDWVFYTLLGLALRWPAVLVVQLWAIRKCLIISPHSACKMRSAMWQGVYRSDAIRWCISYTICAYCGICVVYIGSIATQYIMGHVWMGIVVIEGLHKWLDVVH